MFAFPKIYFAFLSLLLLLIMPALSCADHAQNILLTPEERAWLLDHPVVQVAFDKNLAPVEYRDKNGHPQGLSADYLQRFGTRLGIRFEIPKFTNWTQAMTALKSGQVDMASAIQVTDERKKYLDFTSSYLSLPISVFTREQALYIAYLVQFEGAKVAVVDGYPIKEYLLRDYPLIELVPVKTIENGLELLAEGRVDAYIGSQVATSYALTRGGFANIKIAGDTPYHYELSMAGRKDQPLLTSILQKALDKVSPEERSRMLQRWFAVNFEHHFDYALFYKIGIPLLLLLGLFIYWNRRLSREIGLRHSSERRFRSLIEGFSLDYMFFAYDLDGTLNYLSPSAEQFTHLKASNLIGKKWHSLPFADQVENQLKQIDKAVKRGETPPAVEIEFNARDGSWRCWRISVHPNFDENNQPIGVDGIVNEITEQKIAGLKLLQAKEAAESASRAKSRFLASMSHELRTPLTSILGYSYLLQKKTDLPDQVMRKIKTIHNSGQHLGKMINDVLEISRIEAGHHDLHIESFELRPFLVEIREMFQLQAQEQGLQLIFDLPGDFPETISTDQGKLRQILINLLGNACKFTEVGKIQVKLDWHWLNESHIELQVTVEDTGPGISAAELLNLFQPFEQGRAGRKKGGTGLGLVISQQFAQLLGGDLQVQSEQNQGACFTLTCRLAVATSRVTQQDERADFSFFTGRRILLVDDDLATRNFIKQLLCENEIEVFLADNGAEALTCLGKESPDLVIMDMHMPILNGFDTIRQLKADPNFVIPILAISASVMNEDRTKVLEAGADAFLCKPLDINLFHQTIAKLLRIPIKTTKATAEISVETTNDYTLNNLTEDLPHELSNAVATLEPLKIDAVITRIGKVDVQAARILEVLACDFHYDDIQRLLNRINAAETEREHGTVT